MSVVWARDSDDNEWGDSFGSPFNRNEARKCQNIIVHNAASNKEGYSGEPTSFIDINDPSIVDVQRKYEEKGREEFRNNMKLVGNLIQGGVVMPTEKMVLRTVEKLKRIANGQS
jgi:hypothetical protein